jgi:hypothetical protein
VHRASSRPSKEFPEEISVESGYGEPLGATGSARKNVDVLGAQAALANNAKRARSGAKSEG